MNLMLKDGKDTLEVMVDSCHRNGLEIFYSNRMNDAHEHCFPGILYHIKTRHPEYTIGHMVKHTSPEDTLKELLRTRTTLSDLNFELPVIRDLTGEAMGEICRNYDIDGIELDCFRGPRVFVSVPARPKQIELLNDMMRKMRKMTEEEGLRHGRPVLIAARYLDNLEHSLFYGLDVNTWLEEDLVDLLTPKCRRSCK